MSEHYSEPQTGGGLGSQVGALARRGLRMLPRLPSIAPPSKPVVLRVMPFAQDLILPRDDLETRWMTLCTQVQDVGMHMRLISRSHRFDLREPKGVVTSALHPLLQRARTLEPLADRIAHWHDHPPDDIDLVVADLPTQVRRDLEAALGAGDRADPATWQRALARLQVPLWRIRWLKTYRQQFDDLDAQATLRGMHHYLLLWMPSGRPVDPWLRTIAHLFQTTALPAEYPPWLRGEYRERHQYYEPLERGLPYLTALTAHDYRGDWHVDTMMRALEGLDMDLAYALDVGKLSRHDAEQKLQHAIVGEEVNQRQRAYEIGGRDVRGEESLGSALHWQELLQDGQFLHPTRMVIALAGRDPAELDRLAFEVKGALGQHIKLTRPAGGQRGLMQVFRGTAPQLVTAPVAPILMPSQAVAIKIPWGVKKPDRTNGLFWIMQGGTPVFFDPFRIGTRKVAAHAAIVGKTGSGKTFLLNCIAMRLLATDRQVVMFEPQGHSKRLVQATGTHGGGYYQVTMQEASNPLDPVVTRDSEGRPPTVAEQIAHVIKQLLTLMGRGEPNGESGIDFKPWPMDSARQGLLGKALQEVYAGRDLEAMTPDDAPLIEDLVRTLRGLSVGDRLRETAHDMADEIELNLVDTFGATYNRPTTIDWNFTRDLTALDFQAIPQDQNRLYFYGQAFGALNRYVRQPQRNRNRPLVAMVDEFGVMAQNPALKSFAYEATKSWRTFGAAIWMADQNGETYLDDPILVQAFDNTTIKVVMKQDGRPAERLCHHIDGLHPGYTSAITGFDTGGCVLVWESSDGRGIEVFRGRVLPNDDELRYLAGT